MQVNRGARTIFVLVAAVVGTVLAIAATSELPRQLENFILFLAYFLIPWTAINLTDFYFVRKRGTTSARSSDRTGSTDGGLAHDDRLPVAIGVEIPFMSTTFYTARWFRT